MKIYLNRQPVTGPWGGGNKTLTELCKQITDAGHELVYSLTHNDIDLIFCFDPRPNNRGEWYQNMLNYKARNGTPIVQRVGDCGTHGRSVFSLVGDGDDWNHCRCRSLRVY